MPIFDSLLKNILLFLTGKERKEFEFDQQIKALKKELTNLPLPLLNKKSISSNLGLIFLELYRKIFPYNKILGISLFNKDYSKRILFYNIILFKQFNKKQQSIFSFFSKENIISIYNQHKNIEIINSILDKEFSVFEKSFSQKDIDRLNAILIAIEKFYDISCFDYISFIKFFDPRFSGPTYKPVLRDIDGQKILNLLKDFYYLIFNRESWINLDKAIFLINTKIKLLPHLTEDKIKKDIDSINNILSKKLTKERIKSIILIIEKKDKSDINQKENYFNLNTYFEELKKYLTQKKNSYINSILRIQREKLLKLLFPSTPLSEIKNYNEITNSIFKKNGIETLTYIEILRIIKTYIIFYFEPNLKPIINNIILSGFFSNMNIQKELSDAYYTFPKIIDMLTELENKASPNGTIGREISKFLPTLKEGKYSIKLINSAISDLNKEAKLIYSLSFHNFSIIYNRFKDIMNDYKSTKPIVLLNAKQILGEKNPSMNNIIKIFKISGIFFQILKNFDYSLKT